MSRPSVQTSNKIPRAGLNIKLEPIGPNFGCRLWRRCELVSRILMSAFSVQVCCGWQCDLFEVLGPVRAARPANGGSGCDADVLSDLRALNWMLG